MNTLKRIQLFFKLVTKKESYLQTEVDRSDKLMKRNLNRLIIIEDHFNSSYYGDPYSYDWNSFNKDLYKRGG